MAAIGISGHRRAPLVVATLAIAVGLLYRMADLGFGLPYAYVPDEQFMIEGSLKMAATHTLRPYMAAYPALYPYILLVTYALTFLAGKFAGVYASASAFGLSYYSDPTTFFLLARGVTWVFAGATLYLVFRTGSGLYGPWAGAAGAAILACSSVHQHQSVVALPNAPMSFAAAAAFWWIYKVWTSGKRRDYLLAAVSIGVSVGFKYNTSLLVVPLILAHSLRGDRPPIRYLLEAVGAIPIAFFLTNPYWVIEFSRFWTEFRFESSHMRLGHPGHHLGPPYIWFVIELLKREGLVGLLLLSGLVLGSVRHNKSDALVLSYVLPTLLFILPLPNQGLDYMTGVFPQLALLAGTVLVGFATFANRWVGARTAIVLLALLAAWQLNQTFGRIRQTHLPDTRTTAREWIERNVPDGSRIAFDIFHYNPQPLRLDRVMGRSIGMRLLGETPARGMENRSDDRPAYDMVPLRYVGQTAEWPEGTPADIIKRYTNAPYMRRMLRARLRTPEQLRDLGVEYFLVSTYVTNNLAASHSYGVDNPVHYLTLRLRRAYEGLESGPVEVVKEWCPEEGKTQGPGIRLYRITSF